MIEILIFHVHIVAALYAFTKKWQSRNIKDAVLSLVMIALLFFIGWALTGTLAHAVYPPSWNSIYFNADTLSLLLLLPFEVWFYMVFILKDRSM